VANTDELLHEYVQSLVRELQGQGYKCAIGHTSEGRSCIIHSGPSGDFNPPLVVYGRIPLFPDQGGFRWQIGGTVHRASLGKSPTELVDTVVASMEGNGA
jgi:hypothetical protein